jgi:hypothetical protein
MPKRRHHQEPPTPTPRHPNGPKEQAIATAMSLAVKTPVQSTFQSRRSGIRDLAPE